MRWFVVFLIVANLILYVWLEQQENLKAPASAALPPPDVGRLQLVDEREAEAAGDAPDNGGPSASAVAAAVATPAEQDREGKRDAAAATESRPPVTGKNASLAGTKAAVTDAKAKASVLPTPTASPGDAVSEVAEDRVEQRTTEVETKPVVDETTTNVAADAAEVATTAVSEGDPDATAATKPPAATAPIPDPVMPVCARVGPFQPDQADAMLSRLPPYIVLLSDVTEEAEQVDGYFVIVPALPTFEEGREMLDKLKAAGVKDTWLLSKGPLRRAISLGMFSREAGAKRRVAEVSKKGFPAKLHPRTTRVEHRWLHLKNVDGGDIALSLPLPDGVAAETRECP